tara:strand:+ start:1123 stop:1446 length:324 start_codon:yes stop_codon:yes gene_type:complete
MTTDLIRKAREALCELTDYVTCSSPDAVHHPTKDVDDLIARCDEWLAETRDIYRRDLKLREVEEFTGLSRTTLYRRLREGTLCGRRISNGTWRVPGCHIFGMDQRGR